MTEPSEAVKAMARRCAAKYWQTGDPSDEATARSILSGEWDDHAYTQAALAAILETQRADAELADSIIPMPGQPRQLHGTYAEGIFAVATAIRTGNHYGKDEG